MQGVAAGKQIPLEILPMGDFEPIYGSPLNVQAGELPVLPMSIYGSVAMAHAPDADEGFAAADEFFIYKYDKGSSGLAGLSFDEGTFGVFGYIAKVSHALASAANCAVLPEICSLEAELLWQWLMQGSKIASPRHMQIEACTKVCLTSGNRAAFSSASFDHVAFC